MSPTRWSSALVCCLAGALHLGACADGSQSPPSRPEIPLQRQTAGEGGNLAPLDLVYVCGNKFLATNSTRSPVQVTYRVVGSKERGTVMLPPGPLEDPGHSETELETVKAGQVELYLDEQRLVRRKNEGLPCGPPAMMLAAAAAAGPAESGSWTAPFPWPVVALHTSLLPDGRVLTWGHAGEPQIWDPGSGQFTPIPEPVELFCAGHSFLPDGRLLVTGGHIASDRGIRDITIFSPGSDSWIPSTPMRRGRWYPTNTTLASGSVVIMAGRDEVGDEVAEPEVWSPSGVRQLTGASLVMPYYPRAFLAPNGRVFYAGEMQTTRYLSTSGTGSWTTVGSRRYGARPYGAAVMYEAGKILYAGGGRTTNTAEVIDLNQGSPAWQWTGSMAFPRRNLNATMLPTGEVLVTGGSSAVGFNNVTQAVRAAEIWNPSTGVWTTLASNAVRRTYHSTSLLLPDGRVLHTGSGDADGMPDERNAELFSPPYLAKGARPAITTAPAQVGYGNTFTVETPQAADIGKVSLIRLGSVTHSFDQNQRFQWLSFVRGPGRLTVTAPAGGNIAPPGHYLLFILDGNGVPSIGHILKVTSTSQPSQPNSAPAAAFLGGCGGLTCTFADRSADADGNLAEWTWDFGDGESSTARDPNHLYAAGGTYGVTLTARDRESATGTATQQITVPGQPYPISLSLTTSSTSSTQTATLTWSRAQGSDLYVYRNGLVLLSTPNDGRQVITRSGSGPTTYIFKVCEAGTTICSNPATAQFNGGAPTDNAVPNAIFTPGCSGLTCHFTDGSIDTDGTVAAWHWSFGDGASSTQRHPSHTYASGGTYTVTLTVTDDRGGQGSASRPVSPAGAGNAPPSAGFTASCTDLACDFTDASSDGDGSLTAWEWDFGDGATASAQNPSHGYAAAGTYDVKLSVTDDGLAVASVTRQVSVGPPPPNIEPATDFSSSCTGLSCTFTDRSVDGDGSVAGWSWDFGDGAAATVQNPSHAYAGAGTYTVVLRATDDDGAEGTASGDVTVAPIPNAPPSAEFTASCTGLACGFTDRSTDSDGSVTGWSWSFGDGASSTARNPNRTYAAPGTYTVSLTVTDDDGATHQRSAPVTVTAPTAIVLTATGRRDATHHYLTLQWTGATGPYVDIYQNQTRLAKRVNDGSQVLTVSATGAATYVLKVCQPASLTACSNTVTLAFN